METPNNNGLFWLASYPKSGNTWTRTFIANLLSDSEQPVDINALQTGAIASSREWVSTALGIDIDELSHDEVDQMRPAAYRWLADNAGDDAYHKIHDAYTYLSDNQPLIPVDATRGALVIVRNPLDVAISLANHNQCSIDNAIESLANPTYGFCRGKKRIYNQLRQQLLSWSEHTRSWLSAPSLNRLMVRYEDMQQQPEKTFRAIADFLDIAATDQQLATAINNSQMKKLQAQEAESRFKEAPANTQRFFRKGIVGDWQNSLTDQQVARIIDDHFDVMLELGYIDSAGNPTSLIDAEATAA
ncbi:Desulfo-A47934 sulfotransferase [BD1-7 clade bacterium]|uniref:Desulfo-A47934 sulfotransferase n=1 Tax=BD1-7 clade bacterium TaxID=2029982 RepID=A0A5S9QFU0_9GAMM|nr:Desulfo-A47934 sulfotransferase [BD1-7 clade bacterium]